MKRILQMAAAAVLIPIVPFVVIGELPGDRWLEASSDDALVFGITGAALLASDVLLPIPSSIVGSMLGGRLGLPLGFLWTFGGLCLGNLIGYGLGRLLPERFAAELPTLPGGWMLFLSRPVPVFAEAATMVAGAGRVPFRILVVACAAGNAIYAGAMAANGAALLPGGWAGPGLVLPMVVPVIAWLAWRALRPKDTDYRSSSR